MNASVTVVIVKCELTYIQLAPSISQSLPSAQACTAGSMNRPSARSSPISSRALSNASATLPSVIPRTIR